MKPRYVLPMAALLLIGCGAARAQRKDPTMNSPKTPLFISGVYPHLTVFGKDGEVGIGAAVPWDGKLWLITYPPHKTEGSPEKLYAIDADLRQEIRPESVGGTHANRLIHRESNQLIIGPHFIDDKGNVRTVDITKLVGRLTATARHLTDPANKVYFYDMEGAVYEVDVHTLAVTKLTDRAAPGAHGKGGYTGQGRFVISNNGDKGPNNIPASAGKTPKDDPEAAGALAEWDGKTWRVIAHRQFTDITGPGGIHGAPSDDSPLWAIGWDKRSVLLFLCDGGVWSTFRLPKASHAYDPKHGWYTEWPRIREVGGGRMMMDMHAMFWNFPATFSAKNTGGISPIASHLRYVPDFCDWNGRLVLATDETSVMQNPMAGTSQSNLWFGTMNDLPEFGPAAGWGGPWLNDPVKAGVPSDPFLIHGFARRVAHLYHDAADTVNVTLEVDAKGDGVWKEYSKIAVPAGETVSHFLPSDLDAAWLRAKTDRDCTATVYLHQRNERRADRKADDIFDSLAKPGDKDVSAGIVRPSWNDHNLQFVAKDSGNSHYSEVDENLTFLSPAVDRTDQVNKVASFKKEFETDEASVIMTQDGKRYRLPRGDARYDEPFAAGWPRTIRECESERYMINVHGTFYEMPRDMGLSLIRPVATHNRQIQDFCTWRGLLVLSGVRRGVKPDGHLFAAEGGKDALWFGAIDDLWRLGAPSGQGGPWKNTDVTADTPSDPYLMTGYAKKRVELSHTGKEAVQITLEVDVDHTGWHRYQTFTVPAGKTVTHTFPEGYSAHWVRAVADKDTVATVWLTYGG